MTYSKSMKKAVRMSLRAPPSLSIDCKRNLDVLHRGKEWDQFGFWNTKPICLRRKSRSVLRLVRGPEMT